MAKDLRLVMLLDFYGGLLTEKQAAVLDSYYNQDLSLGEIADDMGISRQGVMAFLKQGEKHLKSFEEKLALAERFEKIKSVLSDMQTVVSDMEESRERTELSKLIGSVSANI